MLSEKLASSEYLLLAARYEIAGMLTIEDIRHARLMQLLTEPRFRTVQALADAIGKSHAQVSQWKNRSVRRKGGEDIGVSNIDSASARLIEEKTGKERGWMDHDPAYDQAQPQAADGPVRIRVRPALKPGEPPPPDFAERTINESQWDTLQCIEVLPDRDDLIADIKQRAEKAEAYLKRMDLVRKATKGSKS